MSWLRGILRGLERAKCLVRQRAKGQEGQRPYLAAGVQTSLLLAAGDLLSQTLIETGPGSYDLRRTLKFSVVGLAIGPGLRLWYGWLERTVGAQKTVWNSVKMTCLDQLLFSPPMLLLFMSAQAGLRGASLSELRADIINNYTDILLNNYKLWPPVQLINFTLVPLRFRVLFVQTVAVGWNTYLSWKLHR